MIILLKLEVLEITHWFEKVKMNNLPIVYVWCTPFPDIYSCSSFCISIKHRVAKYLNTLLTFTSSFTDVQISLQPNDRARMSTSCLKNIKIMIFFLYVQYWFGPILLLYSNEAEQFDNKEWMVYKFLEIIHM